MKALVFVSEKTLVFVWSDENFNFSLIRIIFILKCLEQSPNLKTFEVSIQNSLEK